MTHSTYNSNRKHWSTTISTGHEKLIKDTLSAEKIIYTEQSEQKEEINPVYQVLDYSGIDAIAVMGIKKIHSLSIRVTKWNKPQVTVRASEVSQWSNNDEYLRPTIHIQIIQNDSGHTKYLVVVDLFAFRKLNNPMQYLYRQEAKNKDGYFFKFNPQGLALDCVTIYNL